jgi:hypothetical protein
LNLDNGINLLFEFWNLDFGISFSPCPLLLKERGIGGMGVKG